MEKDIVLKYAYSTRTLKYYKDNNGFLYVQGVENGAVHPVMAAPFKKKWYQFWK